MFLSWLWAVEVGQLDALETARQRLCDILRRDVEDEISGPVCDDELFQTLTGGVCADT